MDLDMRTLLGDSSPRQEGARKLRDASSDLLALIQSSPIDEWMKESERYCTRLATTAASLPRDLVLAHAITGLPMARNLASVYSRAA